MKNKKLQGFTLIELLIVIGIIAILAGIVLVAVNPAEQFGKANDAERKAEIGSVLSAIYQYQTTPGAAGDLPICDTGSGDADQIIPYCDSTDHTDVGTFAGAMQLGTNDALIDCAPELIPSFLRELPVDPDSTDGTATGYFICQTDGTATTPSRVYVLAPQVQVFTDDGDCQMVCDTTTGNAIPDCRTGATSPQDVMCVSA